MRLRRLSAVGLLALAGCGGGGGGGPVNPIGGRLDVPSFTLPAGQTRTVTADLVVNSAGPITLDGELLITPGTSVALLADGDIAIHGPIRPAPARNAASRQDNPEDHLLIVGANIDISPSSVPFAIETAAGGDDVFITTTGANGTISISQDITTKPGSDFNEFEYGNRGGSIYIGSGLALQMALDAGKAVTGPPRSVSITSKLTTGRGGHGRSDLTGRQSQGELYASGYNGGKGGDILIAKLTSGTAGTNSFVLGEGGNGGDCGSAQSPIRARSGTQPGETGQSLRVRPGTGGPGGFLRIDDADVRAARNGRRGSAYGAAGNGGPGGAGGNTNVHFDEFDEGEGGEIVLANGGSGGAAAAPFTNGGDGGEVRFELIDRPVPIAPHRLTITNYGRGGAGRGGCSDSPNVPGTNGGKGGNLTVDLPIEPVVQSSFVGGRAGDGVPPGVPGAGGLFTRTNQRYPNGGAGAACGSGQSNIRFDQQGVVLFTNEQKLINLFLEGPLGASGRSIQVTVASENDEFVLVKDPVTGAVSKSFTLTLPSGQPNASFFVVGGAGYHTFYHVTATVDDPQLGNYQAVLNVDSRQRLTTVGTLRGTNGSTIAAGTVFELRAGGNVQGIHVISPNANCQQWHGAGVGPVYIDNISYFPEEPIPPCKFGTLIQPQYPPTRSGAPRR